MRDVWKCAVCIMLAASICMIGAACREGDQYAEGEFDDGGFLDDETVVIPTPQAGPRAKPTARAQPIPPKPADPNAIVVDKLARTVSIPARVAPQGTQSALKGMVEYLLVARGGKAYETVFVTYRRPDEIREALAAIGLRAGQVAGGQTLPRGSPVSVFVADPPMNSWSWRGAVWW